SQEPDQNATAMEMTELTRQLEMILQGQQRTSAFLRRTYNSMLGSPRMLTVPPPKSEERIRIVSKHNNRTAASADWDGVIWTDATLTIHTYPIGLGLRLTNKKKDIEAEELKLKLSVELLKVGDAGKKVRVNASENSISLVKVAIKNGYYEIEF